MSAASSSSRGGGGGGGTSSRSSKRRKDEEDEEDHSSVIDTSTAAVYSHNVSTHGSVMTEEKLIIRRKEEAGLVQKEDRNELKKGEFYYLIDCQWLHRWTEFTQNAGPFPGKLSSFALVDKSGKPLPNLKAKVDYRGVIPIVYFIFIALHGWDRSPHVCRYKIDITAPPVPIDKVFDIQYGATTDSRILVHDIRQKWQPPLEEIEDEEDKRICTFCCCGYPIECLSLRKEHLEAFIYWMIMCWSKSRSGRSNIKYSQYTPLSTQSEHGSTHGGSTHGKSPSSSFHGSSSHGKVGGRNKKAALSSQEDDNDDDEDSDDDDDDYKVDGKGNLGNNVRVGLADKSYESSTANTSGWSKLSGWLRG